MEKHLNQDESAPPRGAWAQVLLASVLMLATLPGRTQGLGLITEPLLSDLHLDRLSYANLNLWATLLGASLCFPTGWAIDRVGLRWVTGFIVAALGATVWRVSLVTGHPAMLFLLLLATRALGQSALSVCSITTVGRWFPKGSGVAMGVYSILLSVFFAIAFGVVGYAVRANGWRAAWLQISLALVFVVTPLVVIALREPKSPRTGAAANPVAPGAQTGGIAVSSPGQPESGLTLSQALRTGAFWLFAGSGAAFNLVSSGLGLFNEAVLAERGFNQKMFHWFLAVSTLMALGGQFLSGWLTRQWRYQTLVCLALALYAACLGAIPLISAAWQLWSLAVVLGVAGGMIIVVFFSVWSDLFGQRHLGQIQGAAQMLTVVSSALGPVLFADGARRFGSYAPLLFVLAGAVLALALVARVIRDPTQMQALSASSGDQIQNELVPT